MAFVISSVKPITSWYDAVIAEEKATNPS